MSERMSPDEIIETAYELFLEQAPDHLSPEDIVDITLEFDDAGAVESCPPGADWEELSGVVVDRSDYVEVMIGLLDEQEEFRVIYARILLSKHKSNPFHRIQWKPEQ